MTTTKTPSAAQRSFRLNLLANGLDFIREGIEAMYGNVAAPNSRKYALLHIFSGTLLVLKERLRRAHPSLIFTKVAEAGRPGAKTVDFDEVLGRLEGAVGVKVTPDDKKTLRDVQTERNALEHYEADLDFKKVDRLVGELVDFLERFLHDELKESLLKHLSPSAASEVGDLAKIAERERARRHAAWWKRARRYERLSRKKLEELQNAHDYHPKENPDGKLIECPSCSEESVVIVDQDVGVCTEWKCRQIHPVTSCDRCGDVAVLTEDPYCADCMSYYEHVLSKD